jgi:hypothetical protein
VERGARRRTVLLIVGVVLLVAVVAFAGSLAGTAGMLPWQAEPTRIPVAPFEGLMPDQSEPASPETAP